MFFGRGRLRCAKIVGPSSLEDFESIPSGRSLDQNLISDSPRNVDCENSDGNTCKVKKKKIEIGVLENDELMCR